MSLFVDLKTLQAVPVDIGMLTPKFSTGQFSFDQPHNQKRQLFVLVEHISKPKQKEVDYDQNKQELWAFHRDIYSVKLDAKLSTGITRKSQKSVFQSRVRFFDQAVSRVKDSVMKPYGNQLNPVEMSPVSKFDTPMKMLDSPELSLSRMSEIKDQVINKVPLHSDQCKIKIKFYYFEQSRQADHFLTHPLDVQPFQQIVLYKREMNQLIEQLKRKSKNMIGQSRIKNVEENRLQEILKLEAQKKHNNYKSKVVFMPVDPLYSNLEHFQFLVETIVNHKKFVNGPYNLTFSFQVRLQKTRDFAGIMSSIFRGQSKLVNSQLSTNEKYLQKSKYNFEYNFDFSGGRLSKNGDIHKNEVDLYLGKCLRKNLFSMMDPSNVPQQKVLIQPAYID